MHFSTSEILRRVWGVKGEVTIGSSTMSSYWEAFSLYWSFRILIDLLLHCGDLLGDTDVAFEKHDEVMKWVSALGPIPIITTAELKYWSRPLN